MHESDHMAHDVKIILSNTHTFKQRESTSNLNWTENISTLLLLFFSTKNKIIHPISGENDVCQYFQLSGNSDILKQEPFT